MMRIWGRKAAFNVQKVLWCADELQLSYQQIDAGQHYGVVRDPDFLAMNPNGRIPVIETDGFVLWESNAIVRYLCCRDPSHRLAGATAEEVADADRWMDWMATTAYYHAFRNYYLFHARTPEADKTAERTHTVLTDVIGHMRVLDQHLRGRDVMCRDRFSMADIPIGVMVDKWVRIDRGLSGLDNIARYHQTLLKRPAFVHRVADIALDAV
jgi:glutathione S-transferase